MTEPGRQFELTPRFTAAVEYARCLHTETRKGTIVPYMAHLLGVAALVMGEAGNAPIPVTEEMVIAAILHDAVEDHGGMTRLNDIERNFGSDVARMVAGLSDTFAGDHDKKEGWDERKRGYLARLLEEKEDVLLISAADKLYNARSILEDYRDLGAKVWERFKRGRDKQLWYFHSLLSAYHSRGKLRIVDEFERVVRELEAISAGEAK
jgi:GTP pyrophosphokinase